MYRIRKQAETASGRSDFIIEAGGGEVEMGVGHPGSVGGVFRQVLGETELEARSCLDWFGRPPLHHHIPI